MPTLKDIGLSTVQGVVDVGDSLVGLLDIPTRGYSRKTLSQIGYNPKLTQQILQRAHSDKYLKTLSDYQKSNLLEKTKTVLKNPSFALSEGARFLPNTLANIAAGGGIVKTGLNPALSYALGEGVMTAGRTSADLRSSKRTKLNQKELLDIAAQTGLNIAGGYFGGQTAQNLFRLPYLDDALKQSSLFVPKKKILSDTAKGTLNEGFFQQVPQEQLQKTYADYFME